MMVNEALEKRYRADEAVLNQLAERARDLAPDADITLKAGEVLAIARLLTHVEANAIAHLKADNWKVWHGIYGE